MNAIEINGLKKSFGTVKAVDDISFKVKEGSLFAFLGENGAGKSTTINIISTLLLKDEGEVFVDGLNIDKQASEIRSKIGIVFQGYVLDKRLSVKDNLKIRASYYGIYGEAWKKRFAELSEVFSLDEIKGREYGKLSGGQRRRVDIARALINRPKILILDEPTTGLDPQTRKTVWEIISNVKNETGMTVFLTTHYMEETAKADTVVIIDSGKIIAEGSPVRLKDKYSSDYIKIYYPKNETVEKSLIGYEYSYVDNFYKVKVASSVEAKEFVLSHGNILNDFEIIKGDMDDVFLNVTGKKLGGEK